MQDTYFENPVRHWLANLSLGLIPCPGDKTAHGPNGVSNETLFLPNIFICISLYISYWQNLGDWFLWKMQLDFSMKIVYQLGKLRCFMHSFYSSLCKNFLMLGKLRGFMHSFLNSGAGIYEWLPTTPAVTSTEQKKQHSGKSSHRTKWKISDQAGNHKRKKDTRWAMDLPASESWSHCPGTHIDLLDSQPLT